MDIQQPDTEFSNGDYYINNKLYTVIHKPKSFDDLVGNKNLISILEYYIQEKSFPNILITGLPGSGKKTIIDLFVNKYLENNIKSHYLEIIGSLHKSKSIIVETNKESVKKTDRYIPHINSFIKKSVINKELNKIIAIHDFEYMISDTQKYLRKIMESNNNSVRFILSAGSLDSIIESIQSRCVIYKLEPPNTNQMLSIVEKIKNYHNLDISTEVLNELVVHSSGDIRFAINHLQLISQCTNITVNQLYEITNMPPISYVENIYKCCINRMDKEAIKMVDSMINNGYSVVDLLHIFLKILINTNTIDQNTKIKYITILGDFFLINETSLTVNNIYHLVYSLIPN